MSEEKPATARKRPSNEKEDRLKAALRANLRRRKAAARKQTDPEQDASSAQETEIDPKLPQ